MLRRKAPTIFERMYNRVDSTSKSQFALCSALKACEKSIFREMYQKQSAVTIIFINSVSSLLKNDFFFLTRLLVSGVTCTLNFANAVQVSRIAGIIKKALSI